MAETPKDASKENSAGKLDLSGLTDLSLGPNWGEGSAPASSTPRRSRDRSGGSGPGGGGAPRRSRAPRRERPAGGGGGRGGPRGERPRRQAPEQVQPFEPVVEVAFYPEDAPFRALAQAIRTSYRTFELFELARLILEKEDRFVCVVRAKEGGQGGTEKFSISIPDGLPFLTEQEALNHVFKKHMSDFFEVEEYEAEPPSGNFQIIHRCGITGELLGPPNYHRYQAILQEHHTTRLAHLPFERFQQRIETVRDEDAVNQWMEKMKKGQRFKLKEQPEGESEPIVFTDAESARIFLLTRHKDKLIRPATNARFSGKLLEDMMSTSPIRRSVESMHQQQMRFPLDTANHLRGRLRRLNFAVYKKGSKGVSYVCAVKRRFRAPDEQLAENLNDLITFIEDHPNIPAKDLPRQYLGISEPEAAKSAAPVASAKVEEAAEESTPENPEAEAAEKPEAEAVEKNEDGEATAAAPAAEVSAPDSEEPAEKAPADAPAAATPPSLNEEDQKQLAGLKRDLRYLITQGYVIEYSDGRLFAPEPLEQNPPKKKEKKAKEKTAEEAPRQSGTEETSPAPAETAKAPEEASEASEESAKTAEEEPKAVEDKPEAADEVTPEAAADSDSDEVIEAAEQIESPVAAEEVVTPEPEASEEKTGAPKEEEAESEKESAKKDA